MDIKIASGFYNNIQPECGEERGFVVDRVRPQLARAIKPGARVLDLGCGAGRFTFAAEEMGAAPVGIDCANVLLEYARKVAERRGSCVRFVEGDYCSLPFAPRSFDLVLLIDNLVECSYDDLDRMLHQLQGILTPGGLFCVSVSDVLARNREDGYSLAEFDLSTGRKKAAYDPDGRGAVPYHAYFWTVPFAKYVCSRYMVLREEETLGHAKRWLAFRNDC